MKFVFRCSFHVWILDVFAWFPCCFIGAHLKWFWHKNKINSPINSVEFIVFSSFCLLFDTQTWYFLWIKWPLLRCDRASRWFRNFVFGQTLSLPFLDFRIHVQVRRFGRIIASEWKVSERDGETKSTPQYEFEKPNREMNGPSNDFVRLHLSPC